MFRGYMMRRVILFLSIFSILHAGEPGDEFLELLQGDLQKYSQIATDTKQNR